MGRTNVFIDMKELIREILRNYINESRKPRMTPDEIRQKVKTYDTFQDLVRDANFYNIVRRKGRDFFDEVTSGLKGKDDFRRPKRDDDEIRKIALKYDNLKDFYDNETSTWLAARRRGEEFYKDVTKHMSKRRYDDDEIIQVAKKYDKMSDFRAQEPLIYQASINRGKDFHNKATGHMLRSSGPDIMSQDYKKGPKTTPTRRLTDDEIRKEISKYESLKDMMEKDINLYAVARRRGKEFYQDAIKDLKRTSTFTDKDLKDIVKKYSNLSDFRTLEPKAHSAAHRRGKEFFNDLIKNLKKYPRRWYGGDIDLDDLNP